MPEEEAGREAEEEAAAVAPEEDEDIVMGEAREASFAVAVAARQRGWGLEPLGFERGVVMVESEVVAVEAAEVGGLGGGAGEGAEAEVDEGAAAAAAASGCEGGGASMLFDELRPARSELPIQDLFAIIILQNYV
nr:unnamed protein product [Digitaria exilis]